MQKACISVCVEPSFRASGKFIFIIKRIRNERKIHRKIIKSRMENICINFDVIPLKVLFPLFVLVLEITVSK